MRLRVASNLSEEHEQIIQKVIGSVDVFVESPICSLFVIPAKAGIQ
jgi:hypothetical protein